MNTIIGIDYSILSPAICIYNYENIDEEWNWRNCDFYFFSKKVKELTIFSRFPGLYAYPLLPRTEDIKFFGDLGWWTIIQIGAMGSEHKKVFMEDYSYSASGKITKLAECTGILKHQLYKKGYDYTLISPQDIKKCATGKGNASKEGMMEAWNVDTENFNLKELLIESPKSLSPSSDIIDSYFITKFGFLNNTTMSEQK